MAEIKILVPHELRASAVTVNSMPARPMTTHTPPGMGFDIQTWEATDNGPYPAIVGIEFIERR